MAKTIEQLKAQGAEVKNATVVGENTATRVGTLFTDIVEHVQEFEVGQTADTEANTLAISNEAQARAKADEQLNNAIVAEKKRAEAAEKANADNIAKNAQAITDEVARAQEAELANTTAIEAEKNRAETAEKAIIYDVSANNNGAVFESLQALLGDANLSTLIPTSVRRGGMTIRFIQGSEQSSDNKYVQYFLTKDEWSASEADWEKMNLEEEVSQLGQDIVPLKHFPSKNVILSANNTFSFVNSATGYFIKVTGKKNFYISSVVGINVIFTFLKTVPQSSGDAADYATGASRQTIEGDKYKEGTIPSDANYLYVSKVINSADWTPKHIVIDGYDYVLGLFNTLKPRIFVVSKTGSGDYTSLTECLKEATRFKDSTVYVEQGTYDIIDEYKELYGDDFFDNYTSNSDRGIILKNRVSVLFSIGAKVICKYTGNNDNVKTYFSPFNSGELGFLVDGLDIDSKNVRYCFHDERGSTVDTYVNTYRNCKMHSDNSESTQTFVACIGGGLGLNGNITITGCTFSSEGLTYPRGIVTYHNNASANSQSYVVVTNNVFKGLGSFYAHYYGSSTLLSTFIVSNNRFEQGRVLPVIAETADATIINVQVYAFNNLTGVYGKLSYFSVSDNADLNSVLPALFIGGVTKEVLASIKRLTILKNVNSVYGIRFQDSEGAIILNYTVAEALHSGIFQYKEFLGFVAFDSLTDGTHTYDCNINSDIVITADSFPILSEFFKGTSIDNVSHTDVLHKFINASGEIVGDGTTTAANYTNPIQVKKGDRISMCGWGSSAFSVIASCDSSGTNIIPKVIGDERTTLYNYNVEKDGYIICSYNSTQKFYVIRASSSEVNSPQKLFNSSDLNDIIRYLYIPKSVLTADVLKTIDKVRVFNNFSGNYGIGLYSNNVRELLIASNSQEPQFNINGTALAINWEFIDSDYKDFPISYINIDAIQNPYLQPELSYNLTKEEIRQIKALEYGYFDIFTITTIIPENSKPALVYEGDTKVNTNHIVNAVTYPNGVIIAARAGGSIVKIDLDGTETTLLSITGASDWRGLYMDKDLNVYASPHASLGSTDGFQMTSRGLYKLTYGESSMTKVISLYDTESENPTEREENDDTIWTMCQDHEGYLYAGVYCHVQRYAPRIYRSTDGGDTWVDYYNFLNILPGGHHVHTIIYNEYNDALYCIIGEVNTVLKSVDNGTTWTNLNAACEYEKGSSMIAVKDGIIIGSDGGYQLSISKLYADDKTVKTVARGWANTIFAIRKSDITGWLYAFTKIDSSVNDKSYMPPIEAISDADVLQTWKDSSPSKLANWEYYNNLVKDYYHDDAIRPQHIGILISKDNGETWEVLYREQAISSGKSGFVTTGYFRNGECLTGRFGNNGEVLKPLVISENKHRYTTNGVDLSGEILIRTNSTNYIE